MAWVAARPGSPSRLKSWMRTCGHAKVRQGRGGIGDHVCRTGYSRRSALVPSVCTSRAASRFQANGLPPREMAAPQAGFPLTRARTAHRLAKIRSHLHWT